MTESLEKQNREDGVWFPRALFWLYSGLTAGGLENSEDYAPASNLYWLWISENPFFFFEFDQQSKVRCERGQETKLPRALRPEAACDL